MAVIVQKNCEMRWRGLLTRKSFEHFLSLRLDGESAVRKLITTTLLAGFISTGVVYIIATPASASTCAPLGQYNYYQAWTYESTPGGTGGCSTVYVKAHVSNSGGIYWTPTHSGDDLAIVSTRYIFAAVHWGAA